MACGEGSFVFLPIPVPSRILNIGIKFNRLLPVRSAGGLPAYRY